HRVQGCPTVLRIAGQPLQCGDGSVQEQTVDGPLIGIGQRPQFLRKGESQPTMSAGQEPLLVRRQPALDLLSVALVRMPVPAGAIATVSMSTSQGSEGQSLNCDIYSSHLVSVQFQQFPNPSSG